MAGRHARKVVWGDTNRVGSESADMAFPQRLVLLIRSGTAELLKRPHSLITRISAVKFRYLCTRVPSHKTNLFH